MTTGQTDGGNTGWASPASRAAMETNRANWNERADVHAASDGYGFDRLAADPNYLSHVVAFDQHHLTDVDAKRMVHLQCHVGHDSLSWVRLGAQVTGLDQSERSIEIARTLASDLGHDADFVCANVYEARQALEGDFDIVYTSVGALNWLPDIARWGQVVSSLLRPGGRLYVRDAHPVANTLLADNSLGDPEQSEMFAVLPYFEHDEPNHYTTADTYTENGIGAITENQQMCEWNHGLGEIITAVLDGGLRIDEVTEHDQLDWAQFANMSTPDGQWYRLPKKFQRVVPLMFTIQATKT